MNQQPGIKYVQHKEIDKLKWDSCIGTSDNSLIYAYSFYLDAMAQNWDALVLDDYKLVMPLTWKKKMGISYLYQPFITAQLGVFGQNLSDEIITAFLQTIPSKFRLVEISLNSGNVFSIPVSSISNRINYTLDLQKPYEALYQQYRENCRRNIKKANQLGAVVLKDFAVEQVIQLATHQMVNNGENISENLDRFRRLYTFLHQKKAAITYGISINNQLLASCVFFIFAKKAYYILVGNHPNGKTIGASHALIDAFIKDYAEREMLLDFEGSDIRNVAFFYSGFGASQEIYPSLKLNRLPIYLRWLKR